MNQTLVSPCPSCGFDASKHNKVLYDGIFLICYNCNYGWYYNIEYNTDVLTPNNNSYVHNNLMANNSIDHSYRTNDLLHNNSTYKSKNKSSHKKYITKINKYNVSENKHYNVNNIHYNSNLNKKNTLKYHNENKYSNNIYYEPNVNTKVYTKKQSYSINNINTSDPNKIFANKDNYIKIDNTLKFPLKKQLTQNGISKKTKRTNKIHQNITTDKNNNKHILIDINNCLKANNSSFISPTNIKPKNISKSSENQNNLTSINNIDNKMNPNKSSYHDNHNSKNRAPCNKINKNIKNTDLLNIEKTNTLNTRYSLITNPNNKHSLNMHVYTDPNLVNQSNNQKTHYKDNDFKALEYNLSNKTQLGLANINLLKFEEQANYNLEQFKIPLFDIKQIIFNFTDLIKAIFHSILKIPTLIVTIFTRLDIFLKTIAYLFILTISIGFLSYSYYKRQYSIKSTSLKNSDCRNDTLIESNKNLIFENNNFASINSLDNNIVKNYSLSKEILKIVEEKTIAFEKNKGKNNSEKPNINNNTFRKLDEQDTEKLSLVNNIKSAINNSLLYMKKVHSNALNKVKIYNTKFTLQGENNNILVTRATLCNRDHKNSYLIRSLEVMFLEKSGKKIGKRIIIANQLINANSALSINLKINNPPRNTNKTFIFIKDKKQI